jgi:hypothetical protein
MLLRLLLLFSRFVAAAAVTAAHGCSCSHLIPAAALPLSSFEQDAD